MSSNASSEPTLPGRGTPAPRAAHGVVALIAAAIALYAREAWRYRALFLGNAVDDAYISFRYLENLATGDGLVYNAGERVEGYSNLLWILLLLPPRLAGADVVLASQLLGMACGAAAIALAVHAARRLVGVRSLPGAAFVALLPATSGYFAAWSIAGLETSLHALLLVAAWWRYHEEAREEGRRPVSALLFAALAMTRPEGLGIALAAAIYHAARSREAGRWLARPGARRFLVALVALVAAYELFRVACYGPHLFPNSVRAKVGAGLASIARGITYVHAHFAAPYLLLCAPLALLGRARQSPALATAAALVGGQVLLVVAVGGDWSFGRFFAPILPLAAVAFAGAAAELAASAPVLRERATRISAALAAAVYLFFAWYATGPLGEARFFGDFAEYDAERLRIGRWLRDHAPKDARVAVYAAGQIPWASGLYAHDMLGLNDAHIAAIEPPSMGHGVAGHEKSDPDYTLRVIRPDIIVDGHLVPGLREHPEFASRYEQLPGFRYNAVFVTEACARRLGPSIPGAL
ncbi:hypothetical protein [Sorangium sp. So ce1182]|uniref:hypothetical protein n=1 Tax=Sorangium sp. So ce1182 TaxID=3133334 RepID=UPI003F64016D